MELLTELSTRNFPLYIFGWICLIGALICLVMIRTSETEVLGINAWVKPTKFFISTVGFVWTMGWFTAYLSQKGVVTAYNWVVIIVLAFELIWITYQAARGELSHFNISTKFHSVMWGLMGGAISLMTLFTLFIGLLFFKGEYPDLPTSYLWGIRLGILIFVIFAFEGALMGANNAHTVGQTDGGPGLKFLNWSVTHGDLRVAHFVGMHALQVLPLLGYFAVASGRAILLVSAVYFIIAIAVLVQALHARPLVPYPTHTVAPQARGGQPNR